MSNQIHINLDYVAILATEALAEWQDHVIEFVSRDDYSYQKCTNDKSKMLTLITNPLREAWNGKPRSASAEWEVNRLEIKNSLQYVLNVDENIPYSEYKHIPNLMLKQGGMCNKAFFNAPPNLIAPNDKYKLCEWMWEALFPNEDWHTDVSDWVVVIPE